MSPDYDYGHTFNLSVMCTNPIVCHKDMGSLIISSTNFSTGLPLLCVTDAFDHLDQGDKTIIKSIPPSTYWMQKFEKLLTRSILVLTEVSSVNNGHVSTAALAPLIQHFEGQMLEIGRNALDELQLKEPVETPRTDVSVLPNPLIVELARVHLRSFYFMANDASTQVSHMIELHYLGCSWVEQASQLDRTSDWAMYSSETYFRTIILVAAMILRIHHSPQLKIKVDARLGEKSYFAAVKLLRRRSLQPNDVNSHTAIILSKLWHSDFFSKRSGEEGTQGSDSLRVRIRGRAVSISGTICPGEC